VSARSQLHLHYCRCNVGCLRHVGMFMLLQSCSTLR
jgi:hypothetical protein